MAQNKKPGVQNISNQLTSAQHMARITTKHQGNGLPGHGAYKNQPHCENLHHLQYGYHDTKLPVRFIRIWHTFSFRTYHESATHFIFLDAKNNQFWATADSAYGKPLEALICRGLLYYIRNFKIIPAIGTFNPMGTDKTILFGKGTTIEDCLYGSSVPQFRFDLHPWPQIQSRLNAKTPLTDVAGIIMDAQDVAYDRNGITRVNLTLLHSSLLEIHVRLWGRMVNRFRMELRMSREKNVVLVITGLLVKIIGGTITLTSTLASDLYFSPNCKQTEHLPQQITDTYGDFICRIPNPPRYPYRLLPDPDNTPSHSTIQELLHIEDGPPQKFRCDVIILDILLRPSEHQQSCIRCKELATPVGNRYYCRACQRKFINLHVTSTTFMLLVVDHTAATHFALQDSTMQQLTGRSKEDLLATAKLVDGIPTFPQALRSIKNAKCTFEVTTAQPPLSRKHPTLIIGDIIKYTKLSENNQSLVPQCITSPSSSALPPLPKHPTHPLE